MSKRESDWYIPPEAVGLLSTILLIPFTALVAGISFPVVDSLKTANVSALFAGGVAAGVVGVGLLFLARLPLYRHGQFSMFGPRRLDRKHRRFYWAAYVLVVVSVLLLGAVRLRTE